MKITCKREITIEKERSVTFRFADRSVRPTRFCLDCKAEANFITVDEAALLRQTTSRQIFHLIEADRIHFAETSEGLLLVCFASLASANNFFNRTHVREQGEPINDAINL